MYSYWFSECPEVQCEPGHQCEVVSSTGEPFCNPTCQVDNGGCGEDECIEGLSSCVNPDEPCFKSVICSVSLPPPNPGIVHS